ncbi:hypothetical protein E4T48_07491, partial [Aureobasidium sp. EXF-10727]
PIILLEKHLRLVDASSGIELAADDFTASLLALSARNDGLGNDKDSSALFFGWRFSPTLIATIYALLVGSMLNDVRRTEIFARLSRPGGANATHTLCFPARAWWNDPFDALSKTKNNGVRSLALLFASLVNIVVLLVVSPLSAGFLSPVNVLISKDAHFQSAALTPGSQWQTDTFDSVVFRTVAGSILNKSTSAWINPDYAMLPFWLPDTSRPVGSNLVTEFGPQQWQSPTTVFKTEFDCVDLNVANMFTSLVEDVGRGTTTTMRTTQFNSSDGCSITVTEGSNSIEGYHGGWLPRNPQDSESFLSEGGSWESSEGCGNRSSIIVKTTDDKSMAYVGSLCAPKFYSASVNATVDIDEASTTVSFSEEEYMKNRRPMDPVQYDLTVLEDTFLSSNWSNKFFTKILYVVPEYAGPLLAIAASPDYNNDAEALINSPVLWERTKRLHQQFFGEMLLLALDSIPSTLNHASGTIVIQERRIIVVSSIGITLAVLLFLACICVVVVTYTTRLHQRALHLSHDPGSITAAASMIALDRNARLEFEGTDRLSNDELKGLLADRQFAIENGALLATSDASPKGKMKLKVCIEKSVLKRPAENSSSKDSTLSETKMIDPRPGFIRVWMGGLILLVLLALIAVLVVLYKISRAGGLHQTALLDQLNVNILELSTTLTPYSIIPTLLAVGIKLWFRAIAETFKRLQPFVVMAKSPETPSNSISAEYANTPIALVSIKALKHSHWLLALIGAGAFVTEAFTVGMSALWDRELRDTRFAFNVSRQLELRSSPELFHHSRMHTSLTSKEIALTSVFNASLQNWLYGATIEITQSASTPPWSKDTWSFVPLDSQVVQEASSFQNNTGRNITVQTPALRARLECTPVDYASNMSTWLTMADFRNTTQWNATNTPLGLSQGYFLNGLAAQGPGLRSVACCANNTEDGLGEAVVGYWTDNTTTWGSPSMQVKWIYGSPLNGTFTQNHPIRPRWIWSEAPRIAAINCAPVVEQANASIIVDFETGVVNSYEILNSPQNATDAWSDPYLYHGTDDSFAAHWQENITTSYGYIFWDSLLEAANAGGLNNMKLLSADPEDLSDGIFNFREPGLNTDFMSYAMLAMANNSKEALLDPATLVDYANQTFGIFFKHFASEEVSSITGGRAYQPIGEKLPEDLDPVIETQANLGQGALATQDSKIPTPRETEAKLIIPVEQLIMSPVAVFLSISLLAFLVLTTIVMYTVNRGHYKLLPRDVDTLASMLAFVHGSEKLLDWSQSSTRAGAWYRSWSSKDHSSEDAHVKAQMGSFRDKGGNERWGIELVGLLHTSGQEQKPVEEEGAEVHDITAEVHTALLK